MPNCKAFLVTEAERKHVRRRAQFQQHGDASCFQVFFFLQGKVPRMGKYQKRPCHGTLKEAGREEDLRIAGEDRSSRKRVEAGTN